MKFEVVDIMQKVLSNFWVIGVLVFLSGLAVERVEIAFGGLVVILIFIVRRKVKK